MSDISDFQLWVIGITVIGCWLAGFHHGKWAGIQKAEKRQQESRRMQQALRDERNKRR
jgi:hypothetical protein